MTPVLSAALPSHCPARPLPCPPTALPSHCPARPLPCPPTALPSRFSDALRQAAIVCFEPTWQPNLSAMMAYAAAGPAGVGGSCGGSGRGEGAAGCRRAIVQRHFAEAPADCR